MATERPETHNDEARVPAYQVPEALLRADGKRIKSAEGWRWRREELLEVFASEMFGRVPAQPLAMHAEVTETADDALDGAALRRQVTLRFGEDPKFPKLHVLMYLPKSSKSVGVFVGLNFQGNQSTALDPAIHVAEPRMGMG